jgi:leucyl aminopeptidase
MQLRVVTDQPWDVAADVLVLPVAPAPAFDGPLGELDRRSGGELRALVAFGELTGKRYATALAASGDLPAGRLLAVGTGPLAELDRETVVHLGATAERRLAGRPVGSLAIWLADLVTLRDGGAAVIAELLARGVVEGAFDPATLYREAPDDMPPALEELILVAPGADGAALAAAAERGVIIGEGANLARRLANRAANDVSPQVLADEARAIAEANGLWIDVIDEVRAAELGMGMFLAVGQELILVAPGADGAALAAAAAAPTRPG